MKSGKRKMFQVNSEQEIETYIEDYENYAQDCLVIRDHDTSELLPLIFNNGQRILHRIAEKRKAEKGYLRILLLKSRRFGGSTYIEGRFYWRTSLNFNRNTFIVAHEEDSTSTLYTMATLMQEQNPLAPSTRKSNAQELIFDATGGKGLKSQYRLATARNVQAGRAQGIHYFHGSEEAMWFKGGELLGGILQCVPDPPAETEIFRESTANGFGNSFQEDVFEAYAESKYPYYEEDGIIYAWENPKTEWLLIFIPWFAHKKYTRKFESERKKKEFLERLNAKVFDKEALAWKDNEAKILQKKYKLTPEQLYWREWAIENKCRGSVDRFHQEYPSTVEEAFLKEGTSVYSATLCNDLEELCKEPILIGDPIDRLGTTKIRPNKHGYFKMWQRPEKGENYFLTVDSAGGLTESQKEENREPDPSCIDVYNHNSGHQVAQWHGHIDYDLIADMVELIGNLYFRARACVELNNHGYTVVADLKRRKYPMYSAKLNEPGWLTSTKTKPKMVDGLREMARDGAIILRAKETISEMRTYVEESGKYAAASGCHDERVICAGMASQMMKLLSRVIEAKRDRKNRITNWDNKDKDQNMGEYREVTVNI